MKYLNKKHSFETDIESHRKYVELLKEARIWNSMGQYWLGKQTELIANNLLNGENCVNKIIQTEDFFYKTKKLN